MNSKQHDQFLLKDSCLHRSNARSLSSFPRTLGKDDTLETAKLVGTLKSSNLPKTFKYKGTVGGKDTADFIKINFAPEVVFSKQIDIGQVKGGALKATTYVVLPGEPIKKLGSFKANPGKFVKRKNEELSNLFSEPIEFYLKLSTNKKDKVTYKTKTTFKP